MYPLFGVAVKVVNPLILSVHTPLVLLQLLMVDPLFPLTFPSVGPVTVSVVFVNVTEAVVFALV